MKGRIARKGGVFCFICTLALFVLAGCGGGGGGSSSGTPDLTGGIPVASAGLDQNVTTSAVVTLNGSASTAPDGGLLNFFWIIVSKPEDSQAALSNATAVKPTFVPDRDGAYLIALVVTSGDKESVESFVTVTAATGNSAPVANAGSDQSATIGGVITLDGTTSSDANSDTLTYAWSFFSKPDGSAAVLSDTAAAKPTFSADVAGVYVISLVVNDGTADSVPVSVTVTVTGESTGNVAPVANAGPNQNVATGSTVTLDGSASSDADGDTLTFSWSFSSKPVGSAATLSSTSAVKPTFIADVDGDYVLKLVVNDGTVGSQAATVTISAATANSAPVANAGPNQNVATGSTVTLDSSASSDADGDTLTFSWSLSSKPVGSAATLSSTTAVKPTFIADVDGDFVLKLVVNDGTVGSQAATVTISAATANSAPVANAGANQNVATGSTVTLDGSTSSDADGDTLTFSWSFSSRPAGSSAVLSSTTAVKPTFVADVDGDYVLKLVVNDGTVDSQAATVTISAATANSAPVATAGANQNVATGSTVTLDGSASSDADGDTLTFSWSFSSKPAGSTATLSSTTAVKPTFVADVDGDYVLRLVVNDGTVDSQAATVTISAATANSAPVANAGSNQNVATGSIVTLDGSASSDADGDPLTFSWSFTSRPEGSSAVLSSATAVNPSFVADVDGDYIVRLVVNDGIVDSQAATVSVKAVTISLANTAWPTFKGNNQRTGLSSVDTSASSGNLVWNYNTNIGHLYKLGGFALGKDDTIYVVAPDKRLLFAFSSEGTLDWTYDPGCSFRGYPSLGTNGTIYIGSDWGLMAIDSDGTREWYTAGGATTSSPTIGADGTIYIGSGNDLKAFTPDGSLKWKYTTGWTVSSTPAIGHDGTIYVGSDDEKLYAINSDGSLKWSCAIGGKISSYHSPIIGLNGTIYISSGNNLLSINTEGTINWSYTAGSSVYTPSIGPDGKVYVGSHDYYLYAVNQDGSLEWKLRIGPVWSSPAIGSEGTIYVSSVDSYLYAIYADGTIKWNYKTVEGIAVSPAIGSDGTIYVPSGQVFYAIE